MDLPYPVESVPLVTTEEYPEFSAVSGYVVPFHPHLDGAPIKHFDDEMPDVEVALAVPVAH